MFALHSGGDGGDLVGFAEKADLKVARSELATGRELLDPSDHDRAFFQRQGPKLSQWHDPIAQQCF